ncbi:MAG: iron chaperone [Streptosporangiaceae bacterium]
MSAAEIDSYLDGLEQPKRATLERLRRTILDVLPDAEQGISYGVPAFRIGGKVIAGFAAFKHHLSYLPHSGSVFPQLGDDLRGYVTSTGALRFGIEEGLPAPLVRKLVEVRLRQAFPAGTDAAPPGVVRPRPAGP